MDDHPAVARGVVLGELVSRNRPQPSRLRVRGGGGRAFGPPSGRKRPRPHAEPHTVLGLFACSTRSDARRTRSEAQQRKWCAPSTTHTGGNRARKAKLEALTTRVTARRNQGQLNWELRAAEADKLDWERQTIEVGEAILVVAVEIGVAIAIVAVFVVAKVVAIVIAIVVEIPIKIVVAIRVEIVLATVVAAQIGVAMGTAAEPGSATKYKDSTPAISVNQSDKIVKRNRCSPVSHVD
eukprot:GHVT01095751.1.p1 GENE.GHVT01095751.1~~GHVT01095751.1.p1  ORF type:complete len:238 (-),score=24.96 GHVT01095751.1:214-927(-)